MNWGAAAFFLAALAVGLFWLSRRARALTGLPHGRVIYSDMGGWERLAQPLVSERLQLSGRPDYLVSDGPEIIPVEVKSHAAPPQPYPAHVLQLAAYCALVADTYGRRPSYGLLRYRNHTFEVPFTQELEAQLLQTLDWMVEDWEAGDAPRDHEDAGRCRACAYRDACPEALG